MKHLMGNIAAGLAMSVVSLTSGAATSPDMTLGASVQRAIDVTVLQPMTFGTFVSTATGGNVTVVPFTGNTTNDFSAQLTNGQSGVFKVTGVENMVYSFQMPSEAILLHSTDTSNLGKMTVTLATNLTEGTSGSRAVPASGEDLIYVGGTLAVKPGQVAGSYSTVINFIANYQ